MISNHSQREEDGQDGPAAYAADSAAAHDLQPDDAGIDVIAMIASIISEWRFGAIIFVLVGAVAIGYVLSLKPLYVATATFLPQEGHANSDSIAALFNTRGPASLYIGLLKSRSVQDATIEHARLMDLFGTHDSEQARNVLTGKSAFAEGADSIVTVTVRDTNAQNAAMIANAYLDGLQDLDDKTGLAQSVITRRFFEKQLEQERSELNKAETVLEQLQISTGLVEPDTQNSSGLGAIASTRSQITSLKVQLAALLQSETEQNPQVQRIRSQIGELQAQEAQLEKGGSSPIGAAPAARDIPQASLNLQRAQREVHYHDALVSSLASQYETTRLNQDAARSAFRVIDRAVPPEHRDWPPRRPYLIISLIFAAIVAFVLVIVKLVVLRILRDPKHRASLNQLRHAFSRK